jgi:hypothetical protein
MTGCSEGGQGVLLNTDQDYLAYRNLDFGTGMTSILVGVEWPTTSGSVGNALEIRLDSLSGITVGSLLLNPADSSTGYQTISCRISATDGIHDLYLVFRNITGGFCRLNWFSFRPDTDGEPTVDKVTLYPNPATTGFWLVTGRPVTGPVSLELYSIDGKAISPAVQSGTPDEPCRVHFNISGLNLSPGMYFVRVRVGNRLFLSKLVVLGP